MRYVMLVFSFLVCILTLSMDNSVIAKQNEISIIIEVKGDPSEAKSQIEVNHPFVEVVAVYKILFQGLALKGDPKRIHRIMDADFVDAAYPVQTYETLKFDKSSLRSKRDKNIAFPSEINPTAYTGKGVKIAVIDTGIDYNHPDLQANVKGGFDLVDLDDDPMETLEGEGMPTYHGTHVAGIIAANGNLKGVAPDSDLYAYRALGPGGIGTSIQVIAAMEEAVKDGTDIMNLSLGNTVNGPDYPTSKAVNEAAERGIAIVVANGNAGPVNWTTGAPATASKAMSVGAFQPEMERPILVEPKTGHQITLSILNNAPVWRLQRDYEITDKAKEVRGNIALLTVKEKDLAKEVKEIEEEGAVAILLDIEDTNKDWLSQLANVELQLPMAIISEKDRKFVHEHMNGSTVYYKNETAHEPATIAEFSSRGPVTINWMMKPDLIAPGVNVMSTIPKGYKVLNGTSMAAPHVAGAIAVMKEAQPSWTNTQIFGALKTTAKNRADLEPVEQGAGNIQLQAAIETDTIIDNPLLSFGKINEHMNERTIEISIENISDETQQFYFSIPKIEKGITWKLPRTFTISPNEKKTIPIHATFNLLELQDELIQGHLVLMNGSQKFSLPYVVVNHTAEYPRVMGFSLAVDQQDEKYYTYQLYAAEQVKSVRLQLYDPDTLQHKGQLWEWTDLDIGMNEGKLRKRDIEQRGLFYGLLLVEAANGNYYNYETEVFIE